jgi:hypothetical protein
MPIIIFTYTKDRVELNLQVFYFEHICIYVQEIEPRKRSRPNAK